jgi:hypothetical protein
MRLELVAIHDSALGAFARPAFVPSVGVAVRGFTDEVNRSDGEIGKHPSDYTLYHLGSFDDENARFALLPDPKVLIRAVDVVVKG